MVEFLSAEYMTEATAALADDEAFGRAIAGVTLAIQFHVTDAPEGEVDFGLRVADGVGALVAGELDEPDVTVTNTYETAAALYSGEMNTQMAFMSGKLKVTGNMAQLLMNQNVINQFSSVLSGLDVEY